MKAFVSIGLVAFAIPLFAAVCQADAPDAAQSSNRAQDSPEQSIATQASPGVLAESEDDEAAIAANLAKLSAEDRKLAEAQKFCPVMADNRLGSMGVPTKVMIKDKPVFLCCKGCRRKALANPDATLAKVEELKAKKAK